MFLGIVSFVISVCLFLCITASSSFAREQLSRETVTVQTPYGSITGQRNAFGGYSFLGVPFAVPPVGALHRFQPPSELPFSNESSPIALTNVSEYKPMCMQKCTGGGLPTTGNFTCSPAGLSEDCLYLNIFVPRSSSAFLAKRINHAFHMKQHQQQQQKNKNDHHYQKNSTSLLPVLVYFYGGEFMDGTSMADVYDGAYWSTTQNMIIVAPNYRLNVFGSLRTSVANSKLNGNQCLQDQRHALKFVHRVIGAFGGDSQRVAIAGQSAGASSVWYHYTAPASFPYFSRAIAISPPMAFIAPTKQMAQSLGDWVMIELGCSLDNATEQFECLLSKSSDHLLRVAWNSSTSFFPDPSHFIEDFMKFQPCVEGTDEPDATIPDLPLNQLKKGIFNKNAPLYLSTVANETIPFIQSIPLEPEFISGFFGFMLGNFTLGDDIVRLYGPLPTEDNNVATHPGVNLTLQQRSVMFAARGFSDFSFHCPIFQAADLVSDAGVDTWVAVFDALENFAVWWNEGTLSALDPVHVDDVAAFFYNPTSWQQLYAQGCPKFSPEELRLNLYMQQTWGEFVRDGKISASDASSLGFSAWPKYNSKTRLMKNFSLSVDAQHIVDYRGEYCKFWNEMVGYNRR